MIQLLILLALKSLTINMLTCRHIDWNIQVKNLIDTFIFINLHLKYNKKYDKYSFQLIINFICRKV